QDPRTDFTSYLLNFKGEDLDKSSYDKEEAYLGNKEASIFLMSSVFFYRRTLGYRCSQILNYRKALSPYIPTGKPLYKDILGPRIRTIEIENPIGQVIYYILDTPTPFLFLLYDVDKLEAYFNNIKNVIVRQDSIYIPVIPLRRFKFLLKDKSHFNYKIVIDVVRLRDKNTLYIAVKALNDTAGPYGIILTLLVFSTYLRINKDLHLLPNIV
ncbi:transposable element tc1, partial [Colletotrichum incanum]